ncbi:MAG: S9 family peptidase, partial [Gemmatimonadetes bacterium]|nr:S9 family peptidase [Gemmatimonadota bacterium]
MKPLSFLLAAIVASPVSSIAQEPEALDYLDVFELEVPSDVQLSPDGARVVYVRSGMDVMTDTYFANLWVVDSDGENHRPLTSGHHTNTTPRWSPEGDRLAYISTESGSPQVWVRWMDSGETAQITHLTEAPSGLAWSPDGSWLAFGKLVPEAPLKIGESPTPPPGAEWAPPAKYDDRLVFRFDGVGDLPRGSIHLFVVPSRGGTSRQVTRGGGNFGGGVFSWTPDGSSLAFSAVLSPDAGLEGTDSDVYLVRVADGSLTRITDRLGPDAAPSVSPDGRRVAYLGYDDRYQGFQRTELYIANVDGSGARSISAHLDRNIQGSGGYAGTAGPQWSPDGRWVYAVYVDEGDAK